MPFRCNGYWAFALLTFLTTISCLAFTQQQQQQAPETIRKIDLPVETWLSQGEHMEIPWQVSVSRPVLTFQLRNLVRVTAELAADVLQKQSIQHDLHFMVRAAPEGGPWKDGESYTHFRIDKKLDSRTDLQMIADLYLRPGTYILAIIVYDSISGKRNLTLSRVQVSPPESDLLPELLSRLPKIQFLPPPDNAAPLGLGHVSLPVSTSRPVQLDLIVDLSTYDEASDASNPDTERMPGAASMGWPFGRMRIRPAEETASQQTLAQSKLIETASVLSAIDLAQGCFQVTALDIIRRRTILPPTSANDVEWEKVRDQIMSPDKTMVSVADLRGRQQVGKFFLAEMERRMTQPPSCKLNSPAPLHIIAILSRGVSFPSGSEQPKIEGACNCKVIYLQKSDSFHGSDNLKNMLKPLSPKLLQFDGPEDFRRKLVEFTQAIQSSS